MTCLEDFHWEPFGLTVANPLGQRHRANDPFPGANGSGSKSWERTGLDPLRSRFPLAKLAWHCPLRLQWGGLSHGVNDGDRPRDKCTVKRRQCGLDARRATPPSRVLSPLVELQLFG